MKSKLSNIYKSLNQMNFLYVGVVTIYSIKYQPTNLTHHRSLLQMSVHVPRQMVLLLKGRPTNLTNKILLINVHFHMHLHHIFSSKSLPTHRTNIRFNPSVACHVNLQMVSLLKILIT